MNPQSARPGKAKKDSRKLTEVENHLDVEGRFMTSQEILVKMCNSVKVFRVFYGPCTDLSSFGKVCLSECVRNIRKVVCTNGTGKLNILSTIV